MSMISNTDHADCFTSSASSGTIEEANLLAAHMGIFDAHVTDFTNYMEDAEYAAWLAEWEAEESIYDEKYDATDAVEF